MTVTLQFRHVLFALLSVAALVFCLDRVALTFAQQTEPRVNTPLGSAITIQGRVADGGIPANGTVDIQFELFDQASGGSSVSGPLLSEDVPVENGVFATAIDFGQSAFNGSQRFLQMNIRDGLSNGAFTPLAGRRELTATPYAVFALNGWNLQGNNVANPSTQFVGTTNNVPLVLRANNAEILRLEPGVVPNILGGKTPFTANSVIGATISGGGEEPVSGSGPNAVYDSYGTIGGGAGNQAGELGIADDQRFSTVGGGLKNIATGPSATIAGGRDNIAGDVGASVGGGTGNHAFDTGTTIAGGRENVADGLYSVVAGGSQNLATANFSAVLGGSSNQALSVFNGIASGEANTAEGGHTFIGGGELNNASGTHAFIGGGESNGVDGSHAFIGGGESNSASGDDSTVGGGSNNQANGIASTVPGGYGNRANGEDSFAAGRNATAGADGAFAYNDFIGSLTNNTTNSAVFDVQNGFGINTTAAPQAALDVNGNARVRGLNNANALFLETTGGSNDDVSLDLTKSANNSNVSARITFDGFSSSTFHEASIVFATKQNAGSLTNRMTIEADGDVIPGANNAQDLGSSSLRWKTIYSQNSLNTSDLRLKSDVQPLSAGLGELMSLQAVTFNWLEGGDGRRHAGLIAQQVADVLPSAVYGDEAVEPLAINYNELVALVIRAVQDQQHEIDELAGEAPAARSATSVAGSTTWPTGFELGLLAAIFALAAAVGVHAKVSLRNRGLLPA